MARERGQITIVPIRQVEWIEARDDYVAIHLRDRRHLIHVPLGELERRLDPATFLREQQCFIVNLDCVDSLRREPDGKLTVLMRDGTRIDASLLRAKAFKGIGF